MLQEVYQRINLGFSFKIYYVLFRLNFYYPSCNLLFLLLLFFLYFALLPFFLFIQISHFTYIKFISRAWRRISNLKIRKSYNDMLRKMTRFCLSSIPMYLTLPHSQLIIQEDLASLLTIGPRISLIKWQVTSRFHLLWQTPWSSAPSRNK